jgi:hypothetical protein
MQTQTTTVATGPTKSSRVSAKIEMSPAPQPQITKLEPITPYLAEVVSRRNSNFYGRGIPYSPLND